MLYEMWDTGMWILGGVGAGVAVIFIAIPAFAAAMSGSGSVMAFSLCSGLFCGPYLFIGACFATVASAWRLVHVLLTLKFVVFFLTKSCSDLICFLAVQSGWWWVVDFLIWRVLFLIV